MSFHVKEMVNVFKLSCGVERGVLMGFHFNLKNKSKKEILSTRLLYPENRLFPKSVTRVNKKQAVS